MFGHFLRKYIFGCFDTTHSNNATSVQCIQGPIGPVGPQGPKGETGSQGIVGSSGPAGERGPAGPSGSVGPKGDVGPQGETGPKGEVGPAGIQGPKGEVGPAGIQGPQGIVGQRGDAGPTGPQGIQGPKGDQGIQGMPGATGLTGGAGPAGPKGDKGDAGLAGPTGPQGIQGPVGPQGIAGPVGPAGPRGGCDPADITSLQNQINELKIKLDSLAEKRPNTRFADILFTNGITAQDGTPLKGNNRYGKFDYSLEFVTDGTLKIINDVQSLESKPAYINMEVKGEGILAIMIVQSFIHKGTTHLFKKPLCSFTINAEQRNYSVTSVNAYSVNYMHEYAEKMHSNKTDKHC